MVNLLFLMIGRDSTLAMIDGLNTGINIKRQ